MITESPNTIEELIKKKRTDHILTMALIRDICKSLAELLELVKISKQLNKVK
jgi:hypothetical protein